MAPLNAKKRQEEQDSLTPKACSVSAEDNTVIQLPSVTAESVVVNNLTTSLSKSHTCTPSSRRRKSSLTSDQDSTTREKVLKPYWNDLCAQISSQLLLPVETDLPDLGLNSLSTWLEVTVRVVQPL